MYQIRHYQLGTSPEHALNICLKLIRTNTFRTPGGYCEPKQENVVRELAVGEGGQRADWFDCAQYGFLVNKTGQSLEHEHV